MMALKGSDTSSMRRAVDYMKLDRKNIVFAFALGVISFEAVCLVMIWVTLIDQWWTAIVCSVVLCIGFGFLWCAVRRMQQQYRLDDSAENTFMPSMMSGTRIVKAGGEKMAAKDYLKKAKEVRKAQQVATGGAASSSNL